MNNLVLGLLTNVLVTFVLFAINVFTSSAIAVEGAKKFDSNQLSATDLPQKEIVFNLDKAHTQPIEVESVVQDLTQVEAQSKLTLNKTTTSKSVEQVSLSETEAVVIFSDISTSNKNEAKIEKYRAPKDNLVVAQPVVANVKPSLSEVKEVQRQLRDLDKIKLESYYSSPSMSIYVPLGYGADNNTAFVATDYQSRTRFGNSSDGAVVFGVGLGDAKKSAGVVLSYTLASVSNNFNSDFGIGGFNVKVHRQFKGDWAAAVGMNGVVSIGRYSNTLVNDFDKSLYGVVTKVIRTQDDINKPFSRVAVTAGVGNGQFRTENSIVSGKDNFNAFGNVAVRVHPQASLIAEWTGQDLAVGASIAPFKNIPIVITPALRDIAGSGRGASDRARFVMGAGFGFKF
ncbi:MAG: hypothetical protein WBA41_24715 [Rivularia sp. (in: cyanobacteria)]